MCFLINRKRCKRKESQVGEKKRVVIIGGGVGGSLLAHTLQSISHVILIDQKEYFDIPWARLRSVVEPSFADRSVINHSEYLTQGEIIVSTASNITDTEVVTSDNQTYPYDYLVVATGHIEAVPQSRSERLNIYRSEFEKLKSANSILIIGGGPTGVELAGEIVFQFPEKKVILVHRGTRLLEFIGSSASQKALEWLRSKNVQVIFDQCINLNNLTNSTLQTSTGQTITADCHFRCTGKPMSSFWLRKTILKDSLDIHEQLMVDANLRVRGNKNIFGIGDITDVPEIKQGTSAQRHALLTAKNLKLLMAGVSESKLITYKPTSSSAVVSLGRKEGVAHYCFMTLTGYIPGKLKSEDLYVGDTRKQLGLKPNLV